MTHGLIETARDALALFQFTLTNSKSYQGSEVQPTYTIKGTPFLLTDIPAADYLRIPPRVMWNLIRAQERVHIEGAQWKSLAAKIQVRQTIHILGFPGNR